MYRRRIFPHKTLFFIGGIGLIFIGYFIGYYKFNTFKGGEIPFAQEDVNKISLGENEKTSDKFTMIDDDNESPVNYSEESIGHDTQVVYRVLYRGCGDTIEELTVANRDIIGFKEVDLIEYLDEQDSPPSIQSFGRNRLVLFEEKEGFCPNHHDYYLVTENKGYLVIYYLDDKGEKNLIETTTIPVSILPPMDRGKLKKGIFRKTKIEAYRLLEDYSS